MKQVLPLTLLALSASHLGAVSLINLNFSGPLTPVVQQTFVDAAAFWNSAITGYDLIYNANGVVVPHSLTISASTPAIDGPNNVLGEAEWLTANYYDNNPVGQPTYALYYADTGRMQFDSADVATLVANNTFYSVVLHEMAHVIGFGTLWSPNNDVNSTTYPLYTANSGQFTGPNALAQWRSEFNRPSDAFVPVELGGGGGTANGHWNELDNGLGLTGLVSLDTGMDFRNELMTGWASSTFFLSRATLGSFDDIGYTVDYSKAGLITYLPIPETTTLTLTLASAILLGRRRRSA